jgi:hypothetical protein
MSKYNADSSFHPKELPLFQPSLKLPPALASISMHYPCFTLPIHSQSVPCPVLAAQSTPCHDMEIVDKVDFRISNYLSTIFPSLNVITICHANTVFQKNQIVPSVLQMLFVVVSKNSETNSRMGYIGKAACGPTN